ncbi:hypothetical protein E4U33_001137, partial [Claviceps sp. LM78 group G4]
HPVRSSPLTASEEAASLRPRATNIKKRMTKYVIEYDWHLMDAPGLLRLFTETRPQIWFIVLHPVQAEALEPPESRRTETVERSKIRSDRAQAPSACTSMASCRGQSYLDMCKNGAVPFDTGS